MLELGKRLGARPLVNRSRRYPRWEALPLAHSHRPRRARTAVAARGCSGMRVEATAAVGGAPSEPGRTVWVPLSPSDGAPGTHPAGVCRVRTFLNTTRGTALTHCRQRQCVVGSANARQIRARYRLAACTSTSNANCPFLRRLVPRS